MVAILAVITAVDLAVYLATGSDLVEQCTGWDWLNSILSPLGLGDEAGDFEDSGGILGLLGFGDHDSLNLFDTVFTDYAARNENIADWIFDSISGADDKLLDYGGQISDAIKELSDELVVLVDSWGQELRAVILILIVLSCVIVIVLLSNRRSLRRLER